jgi:SRSO17 transposase
MLDGRRRSIQPMAVRLPDGNEQNLQTEWPERAEAPTDYWLSSRPAATELAELVRLAKIRWRIEHD